MKPIHLLSAVSLCISGLAFAAGGHDLEADEEPAEVEAAAVGGTRRTGTPPALPEVGTGPTLTHGIAHALRIVPQWGLVGAVLFLLAALVGSYGVITGWIWGHLVEDLQRGETPTALAGAMAVSLVAAPVLLAEAFRRYPRWWIEVMLRARMAVLVGQTQQHRLTRTPPGEVVARSMDADRYARYADRWVDVTNGLVIVVATAVAGGSLLAGGVLLAVMTASALASSRSRLKMEALRRQAALEAERVRIARDMHDELGTSLTQIALLADLAQGETHRDDAPHLENVVRISRELVRSMDELVEFYADLKPSCICI